MQERREIKLQPRALSALHYGSPICELVYVHDALYAYMITSVFPTIHSMRTCTQVLGLCTQVKKVGPRKKNSSLHAVYLA